MSDVKVKACLSPSNRLPGHAIYARLLHETLPSHVLKRGQQRLECNLEPSRMRFEMSDEPRFVPSANLWTQEDRTTFSKLLGCFQAKLLVL